MCNLCELNVTNIESQEDLNKRSEIAAFFGTLQAGFTDFHYLRPIWKKTCEKDALLGIGMTGIASGEILKYNLEETEKCAEKINQEISNKIGINKAARITCIKPSGTTSCVLGSSSGIHAWHDKYYLRTVRFNKNEAIVEYLINKHPELCEDDVLRTHDTICVRIPIKAPKYAIMRTETAIDTLERVKKFATEWVKPGHINGDNTHNVSATISIKNLNKFRSSTDEELEFWDEWYDVGEWMWNNKEHYNGLSILPYDGGTYTQAPFESITEEEYDIRVQKLSEIDLTQVKEYDDNVQFTQTEACAGGKCSLE